MLSLLGSDGLSDYVQIVMSNIFGSLFYILFLSKFLHVLRCGICFGQVFYLQLQERALCYCGFSPLMSSLSDRNMRLEDVLLPPRIGACTCGCKDCLLYA